MNITFEKDGLIANDDQADAGKLPDCLEFTTARGAVLRKVAARAAAAGIFRSSFYPEIFYERKCYIAGC